MVIGAAVFGLAAAAIAAVLLIYFGLSVFATLGISFLIGSFVTSGMILGRILCRQEAPDAKPKAKPDINATYTN